MNRRELLKSGLAATSVLAMPRLARAQSASLLKFIPGANLAILDPTANTSAPTRMHGYMVFDTLYGLDSKFQPHPQMVEGHTVSDDGRNWKLTLREGLKFHDGEPVRGRDVVASINRWAKRDSYGKILMAATDELTATSDKDVTFRLKKRFPLLPAALGKVGALVPVIMPERLANTDPSKPLSEMVGSGPFQFLDKEYSPGALAAYKKFAGYVPRANGPEGHGSAPKIVHFDRVEWHIIPDPSTALASIQSGEMDWWETPLPDFLPMFEGNADFKIVPSSSQVMFLRLNHLTEPFNNPAIRRLVLSCIDQEMIMQAVGGAGKWRANLGLYTGSMENEAGYKDAFKVRKDFDNVRKELTAAGYKGERLVMLVGTDGGRNLAASQVGADIFKKMGFNVDFQTMDWGTASQRRTSMEPLDKGGWSCFFVGGDSEYFLDQATNFFARGNGKAGWFGWPTSEKLEQLTTEWFDAPDISAQKAIAENIQLQAWKDVPYIPCGELQSPGLARGNLSGFAAGFPKFYGVKRV
ncbi:ABC transporter substrate-binding protein [Rhizobium puerariae]|uniref:ABC transporter substrate-binding protein n=1 Tax=Rhizobium puerariae TaxID=1585791 RepID=A0ABV6AMU6_9HYPH